MNWRNSDIIAIKEYNTIQSIKVNRYLYIYRYTREGKREKPNEVWFNRLVTASHEP